MDLLRSDLDPTLVLQQKRRIKRELLQKPGLVPKKVAIMSGSTIGEIKNILELFLLANGRPFQALKFSSWIQPCQPLA